MLLATKGKPVVTFAQMLDTECFVCGGLQTDGPRRGKYVYRRCRTCGLLSSSPLPTPTEIQAHYRSKFQSGNYEAARRFASQYRRVHRQLADFVRVTPGKRVLDIGCFTGELLNILAARGADVYGLELQPEAVAIANQHLPGRIFQADVFGEDFPPGPYDIVTMMGLIEHVRDPAIYVKRAYDLLNRDGKIVLQTPDAGSLVARLAGSHWPPLAPVEHIHLFSRPALNKLLINAGFTDVHFRSHVKTLPVAYVYELLSSFGPEWRSVFVPFYKLFGSTPLPFYVGEMMVSAVKRS